MATKIKNGDALLSEFRQLERPYQFKPTVRLLLKYKLYGVAVIAGSMILIGRFLVVIEAEKRTASLAAWTEKWAEGIKSKMAARMQRFGD